MDSRRGRQPPARAVIATLAAIMLVALAGLVLTGLEVVEVTGHDWMKDPLSRTTWMTHRPGQLTRDLTGLQQPAGVVHFASSDNASLWGGFIDGAIESGLREARRVAAELMT